MEEDAGVLRKKKQEEEEEAMRLLSFFASERIYSLFSKCSKRSRWKGARRRNEERHRRGTKRVLGAAKD